MILDGLAYTLSLSSGEAKAEGLLGFWEQPGFHGNPTLPWNTRQDPVFKNGRVFEGQILPSTTTDKHMFSAVLCVYGCVHVIQAYTLFPLLVKRNF